MTPVQPHLILFSRNVQPYYIVDNRRLIVLQNLDFRLILYLQCSGLSQTVKYHVEQVTISKHKIPIEIVSKRASNLANTRACNSLTGSRADKVFAD